MRAVPRRPFEIGSPTREMRAVEPDRWHELSPLLDRALELDADGRAQLLAQTMARDAALGRALERLLDQGSRADREGFLATRAAPRIAEPVAVDRSGQVLGAYTLEERIGSGGMGAVWSARRSDGQYEGEVAIKFLHAWRVDAAGERRFRREASALARLDHPGIARLLDAGVAAEGVPYLVLERVRGEAIDVACAARRATVAQRIELVREVLDALGHAHQNLVLHRDIKPSNLLVTADGRVKLLDFGISELLTRDGETSREESREPAAYTLDYAAPEQIRGDASSTATDVYAVGVLLHQLLTGRHPTARPDAAATERARAILEERPEPPSRLPIDAATASERCTTPARLRRALAGDLDGILAKALQKRPEDRYASARELAEDLRRHLTHHPVGARPPSVLYAFRRFVRRNRVGVAASGAGLLALVGALGFAVAQAREARIRRDQATLQAERSAALNELMSRMLQELGESGQPITLTLLLEKSEQVVAAETRNPALAASLQLELARRYLDIAESKRALAAAERSLTLARAAGDDEGIAAALCMTTYALEHTSGNGDEARLTEARAALARAPSAARSTRVTCLRAEAIHASRRGDDAAGMAYLEEVRRLYAGQRPDGQLPSALSNLGAIHFGRGDFAKAYAIGLETLAAREALGLGTTIGTAITRDNLGVTLLRMGEVAASAAVFDALHRRLGEHPADQSLARSFDLNRGAALRRLARHDAALVAIGDLPEALHAQGELRYAAIAFQERGAIRLGLGNARRAIADLDRALTEFLRLPVRSSLASRALRAQADLAEGRLPEARRRLDDAIAAHAAAGGSRTDNLVLPVSAARAEVELAAGDLDAAERAARDALAIAQRIARREDASADVGEARLLLARIAARRGDAAAAKALARSALPSLRNGLGESHPYSRAADALAR